jgi:hypothetical protein
VVKLAQKSRPLFVTFDGFGLAGAALRRRRTLMSA